MPRPAPIEIDLNTWIIMRHSPTQPVAIIERVTHENGITRYMLYKWPTNPTARRLVGVFDSLTSADDEIPYVETHHPQDNGRGGWPPGAHQPMFASVIAQTHLNPQNGNRRAPQTAAAAEEEGLPTNESAT